MKFKNLQRGDIVYIDLSNQILPRNLEAEFYSFSTSYSTFCYLLVPNSIRNGWVKQFPENFSCQYRKFQHHFYEAVYWEIKECEI